MGKRQIGQMQPFEFVLALIIADLATIPMAETGIPLLYGLIPLLTLVVIHFLITTISRVNKKAGELISGKPIVIIHSNEIDYQSLKELNLSVEDLTELLRNGGFFDIKEVAYAIMETNGTLSIMPKSSSTPIKRADLKLPNEKNKIQDYIIADGKFQDENMRNEKYSKNKILKLLKKNNVNKIENVIFLSKTANNNEFLIQEIGKEISTIYFSPKKSKEQS